MKLPGIALLFLFLSQQCLVGQVATDSLISDSLRIDSLKRQTQTADSLYIDSLQEYKDRRSKTYEVILQRLLKANRFARFDQPPVSLVSAKKQQQGKEYLFYLLAGLLLLFGFFKVFYLKYFNNIFRVFFNTSLRQNQLTDLLLQARLPSLIFNVFFTITGGTYLWFILQYYGLVPAHHKFFLLFCIVLTGVIYSVKFLVLKFLGWVTGLVDAVNTYIFVVFLINKILGIILIPFIIMLAFASTEWLGNIIILSLLVLGIFFLLRFFRSYNLIQHQVRIRGIHFFLYILCAEILPLFLLFKGILKMTVLAG